MRGGVRRSRAHALPVLGVAAWLAVVAALYGSLLWAPEERVMGDVQRLFYFHLASAWVALGPAFTTVFVCSVAYLARRRDAFDRVAAASAEIGVLFTTITLATGPLWARPVWGSYWTWDPRLTTTLILWFMYAGYLLLRSVVPPGERRARLAAVYGIIAWANVPLVFMSIRWWRTIHPQVITGSGMQLEGTMAAVLGLSLAAFTLLFVVLLLLRTAHVRTADDLSALRRSALTPRPIPPRKEEARS